MTRVRFLRELNDQTAHSAFEFWIGDDLATVGRTFSLDRRQAAGQCRRVARRDRRFGCLWWRRGLVSFAVGEPEKAWDDDNKGESPQ
jgi:hypothetical protein